MKAPNIRLFEILRGGLVLTMLLLSAACVHQVQTGRDLASHPKRSHGSAHGSTAVAVMMSRQVQNARDAGDGDVEAKMLRQRLAANANDVGSRILLARMYMRRGLPDLALEHYRMAVAQFPESAIAAIELVKTLREMDAGVEALRVLQASITRLPRNWELLSLRGILEDEGGEFVAAESSHRAALEIEPARAALRNNLGYNLLLQGKAEEAAVELRRAIEVDAGSAVAHNNLGVALAMSAQSKSALAEWQRSADPAAAHNNLGAVLMEQGRNEEARKELAAALDFRGDYGPALANLRMLAERTGEPFTIEPRNRRSGMWSRIFSRGKARENRPAPEAAGSGAQ